MYIDKNSNEGFWNSPWKVLHEYSAITYYVTKVRVQKLFNVMKDIIRRPVEHSSRSVPQRTAEGTISSSNNMIELFSDLLI